MSAKLVYKIQEYDHIVFQLKQERRQLRKESEYIKKILNQTESMQPFAMEDQPFQVNEQTFKQRSLFFSKIFQNPFNANENGAAGDNHIYLANKIKSKNVAPRTDLVPIPNTKSKNQKPKTKDKNVMVGKSGCKKNTSHRHFSGGFFILILCLI